MEVRRKSAKNNLRCEVLLVMRCLVADVVFLRKNSAKVWYSYQSLVLVQARNWHA